MRKPLHVHLGHMHQAMHVHTHKIHIKHICTKNNKDFFYLRYLMAIKAFHLTGLAKEFRGSSFIESWNTKKEARHLVFGCLGSEGFKRCVSW